MGGIAAVVAAAAIGGTLLFMGGGDDATTSSTTTTSAPVANGAVTSLEDARQAVVRIETTGTFASPDGSLANQAGGGSGFIISASGLAVTNNHVVTGAGTITVHLEGDDRAHNAYVVAASECSDLAVIEIDGDGYPYLDWYDGAPTTGMPIFAAGFPLGDPEYTLVEGIISKQQASGESSWASVDAVLEHTADTLPGNSGGPLLTADGAVIGVNYAGNGLGQGFAISNELARPLAERLAGGVSIDSIGLNGEAYVFDESTYGIWVYSVEQGSAADAAGVQAGDLLWTIQDTDIGADGTMATYCDVLRSHAPGSTLSLQVFRPSTGEILGGQLNGRPLEAVFTPPDSTGGDVVAYEYQDWNDSTGSLAMTVPTAWLADTFEGLIDVYSDGSLVGPQAYLAPDLNAFAASTGPGATIFALWGYDFTADDYLDAQDDPASVCTYAGRDDFYDGTYYEGRMDTWTDCGPNGGTVFNVAAYPPDGSHMVGLRMAAFTDADWEALTEIVRTFNVVGEGDSTPDGTDFEPQPGFEPLETEGYATRVDDIGYLAVAMPEHWNSYASAEWNFPGYGSIGRVFMGSTDLNAANEGTAPLAWMAVTAEPTLTVQDVLAWADYSSGCTMEQGWDQLQGEWTGWLQPWTCPDGMEKYVFVATAPMVDGRLLIDLEVWGTAPDVYADLVQAMASFEVLGP